MSNSETPNRRIKIACPTCSQKIDVTECEAFSHLNCPSCKQELVVPKWFHSFLLEEPEGEGGMATVYRALDIQLDREVAIKVLNREQIGTRVSSELFLHEARTAAAINHSAVVPIYSCGENEGAPYIVMQYMNGGNLEERLARADGRLPVPQVVRWMRDISDGLRYASDRGVIHHDIKPANILLDIDHNAKIGDFGLAQVMCGGDSQNYLAQGKMWLSPHYVSPEKVLNGTEGAEGDIYSLGATFYHLLTGKTPFHNPDTEELMRMRLLNDPVMPSLIRPEISEPLSHLILSMMDRNPSKRPQYPEIIGAIDSCLQMMQNGGGQPASNHSQQQTAQPKKRVMHVDEARLHGKRRRVSHLGSLLFLLFVVCIASVALLLPVYGNMRAVYNYLPILDAVYGPLPLEMNSFVPDDDDFPSFSKCVGAAEDVFSDDPEMLPLAERINAGWLLSVNALLEDSSEAVPLARTLLEQLEGAAQKSGVDVRADLFCLRVIAEKANTPPDKCYFSEEQLARCAVGRFLRSIYDTDPESFSKRTIQAHFNDLEESLHYLKPAAKDEQASWVFRLFYPELDTWRNVTAGKKSPDAPPIFTHITSNN